MKFQIYGKDFKTLVDRIGGIVPKRTALQVMECVKIEAHKNNVEFSATDSTNYATIRVYANVYEDGVAWVLLSDLKKILAINDDIIITTSDLKLDIRSSKKSYEIPCHTDYDDIWIEKPLIGNNDVVCIQSENEFLKHLSILNCARSEEDANKMMTAFYLDLSNRRIVTLDGHRIGMANLVGGMFAPNARGLNLDGSVYSALKSLIGKTKNDDKRIEVYADDKYVEFKGEDYVLTSRLLDGKYFDYEKLTGDVRSGSEYTYRFNTKELLNIAKEYSKVVTKDNKAPMIFYNNNGSVATGVQVANYRTSDVLENVEAEYGMGHEWYVGVNPHFIMDACGAFSEEAEIKGAYSFREPIMIMDETYEFLILPININEDNVEFVKRQVA